MNSLGIRLLADCTKRKITQFTIVLGMLLLATGQSIDSLAAQGSGPADYRVEWITLPNQTTSALHNGFHLATDGAGAPEAAFVVGYTNRSDRSEKSAFIYDHLGTIDINQPRYFYDILDPSLGVQFPPTWLPTAIGSGFVDVNTAGRIVGYVLNTDGTRIGCYLDLFATDGSGNPLPRELKQIDPPNVATHQFTGRDVNEMGDILVACWDGTGSGYPYIFNPESLETLEIPILTRNVEVRLNLFRQVVGNRFDDFVYRYTIGGGGNIELFPDLVPHALGYLGINDFGEFSARTYVPRGKNRGYYPVRIGASGIVEWQGNIHGMSIGINNARDIIFQGPIGPTADDYYLYNRSTDQTHLVKDLDSGPNSIFQSSNFIADLKMSEQDKSGFPWILGRADTDGDGSSDQIFLMTPGEDDPAPGITINPISGLVTTESGGQDSFDVVLDTKPMSADVTIGISSSNTAEGTADVASLTFTSANWDTPQTVTVTGVDDPIEDGNATYSIVIGPAVSTDPAYDGIDADDVSVTNLDDDGPTGGTQNYSSGNIRLNIPDNDPGGVSHTIGVGSGDGVQIISLTITLNISHSRPSDLTVTMTGPDGTEVTLTNFSGDNNVTSAFIGTSTQGQWTLKAVDDVGGRKGKINSWSINVDY